MKDYAVDKIRNVAIVGHGSSGKTSLTAAFLFNSGVTTRLTKVSIRLPVFSSGRTVRSTWWIVRDTPIFSGIPELA